MEERMEARAEERVREQGKRHGHGCCRHGKDFGPR